MEPMKFEFNFYSSILLIFWVHGMVYALLCLKKGIELERSSEKWLSLFLLLCAMYIMPWMMGFAGWYDGTFYRDVMFYTPHQHLFVIGPVVYFYVQSLLNPSFRFGGKLWLHFVPGFLYILYSLVMFVTDKLILKRYYFLADGTDRDLDFWYQASGLISMVVYFWLSIRFYNIYKRLMEQVVSYADSLKFKWVRNFLFAFLAMQVFQVVFYLLTMIFPSVNTYVGTWWYFLSFSVLFYYISITGYSNSIETKVPFSVDLSDDSASLNIQEDDTNFDASLGETPILLQSTKSENKASESVIEEWKPKIIQVVRDEKAFQNPELTLTEVAKRLQTNPSFLSKMVNQGFEMNFNDFVNGFRIEAVKACLDKGEQRSRTLLGIAFDCGFNSKATFNRAFKKVTGANPKDYASN